MKAVKTLIATMAIGLSFSNSTFAQSTETTIEHKREIGVRTTNFNTLDLVYAFHTKANRMVRLRAGQFHFNVNSGNINTRLSLAVGFQRYKTIDDKFSFYHGFEPALFNTTFGNDLPEYNSSQLRLGYMIGFNFDLNEKLKLYVETIPNLYYNYTFIEGNPNTNSSTLGLSSSSQLLGFGLNYKF